MSGGASHSSLLANRMTLRRNRRHRRDTRRPKQTNTRSPPGRVTRTASVADRLPFKIVAALANDWDCVRSSARRLRT